MKTHPFLASLAAVLASAAACGEEDEPAEPTAMGCPSDSAVTYEKDIAPFMTAYCVSCHAASVPAAQRRGAPSDHNFETEAGILKEAEHIAEEAGASATVTNTSMPPKGSPAPSVEERRKLSEWIACNPVSGQAHDHDAGDHTH